MLVDGRQERRPREAQQGGIARARSLPGSAFQLFSYVLVGFNTSARVLRIAVLTLFASVANSFRCSLIFFPFALTSVASC